MLVPFVDLKKQYVSIKTEIDRAIESVIAETAFIKGKYVSKFEDEFSNLYGVEHFISCANGTDAIYVALKSLGIGPMTRSLQLQILGFLQLKQYHNVELNPFLLIFILIITQ